MKQLLIVNSAKALNANTGTTVTAYDFSGLDAGAISFFELGGTALLSAAPKKNFGIALGRPNGQIPFVIPEVDIKTLNVTWAQPKLGAAFKRKFTFPTPVVGKEYTIIFVKKATVPHERNTWTCSIVATTTTAATEATALKTAIESKLGDYFTVSVASSAITIVSKNIGEQWECKFADNLTGTSWAGSTDFVDAEPTIGDKAYIQDLASRCAAGKGFNNTEQSSQDLIPGYPEVVENLVPNTSGSDGASTAGYAVCTLRFKVGRDAAKTRDERVWQVVHIAIPITNPSYATVKAMLPEGDFYSNMMNANAASAASAAVAAAGSNG